MIMKMFVQTVLSFGAMGALLFLGAGTLHGPPPGSSPSA